MRTFLLGIIVGFLAVSLLAAVPQSSNKRETIWLGADLTLGMSENAAIKKLAESNYKTQKQEPPEELRRNRGITSMWFVETNDGDKHSFLGVVAFASGKLASVTKELLPNEGNEVELGRQLYFAMRDLESEGNSQCTIETTNKEVPEYSEKTANLRCGKKTVVIRVQKLLKQDEMVILNEELTAN